MKTKQVVLSLKQAEELLSIVNLYWTECDYQLSDDKPFGVVDGEERSEWEGLQLDCKKADSWLSKKIEAVILRQPPYIEVSEDGNYNEVGIYTKSLNYLKLYSELREYIVTTIKEASNLSQELGIPFYMSASVEFLAGQAGWKPSPNLDFRLEDK
jgi:hypothetical protein